MDTGKGSKKRATTAPASNMSKRTKRDASDEEVGQTAGSRKRAAKSPSGQPSSLSDTGSEAYKKAYYEAALATLQSQRNGYTYQANDANIMYQHLRLATPANANDVSFVTDAEMRNLCSAGKALPSRAVVLDRGIPKGAPASLSEMADRAHAVYGGSNASFTPQRKSAHMEVEEFHDLVDIDEFVQHWTNPREDEEIWNLLEAGTQMFENASAWIPDYVSHDNLLHDIRARITGTYRSTTKDFIDKFSWYLAGDGGAYSPLHFDSHGFGTFLQLLSGELLLMFCNTIKDEKERAVILENIRTTGGMTSQEKDVFRKHMRYVILQPGQLWFMEPGTFHAVYRKEGTLIFGGHYISKKRLGLWIDKMKEHLRWYNGTNEDPNEVLLYLQNTLELIENARDRHDLDAYGTIDEIQAFLVGARELLEKGESWIKNDGWESIKGKSYSKSWKTTATKLLRKHRAMLKPHWMTTDVDSTEG